MIDSELQKFFRQLAIRFSNEDDLSDITWTLLESSEEFRDLFLEFFEISPHEEIKIKREKYLSSDSRPDFVLYAQSDETRVIAIIENKIYDEDYHTEKYKRYISPDAKFWIISNHMPERKSKDEFDKHGVGLMTWSKFVSFIEQKMERMSGDTTLILAYINYVKEVCALKTIEKITLDKNTLNSMMWFSHLCDIIIRSHASSEHQYKYNIPEYSDYWMGARFDIVSNERSSMFYLGLEFKEEPKIQIWFGGVKNQDIEERFKKWAHKNGEYFYLHIHNQKDEDGVSLYLKNEIYTRFLTSDKAAQEEIMRGYFTECVHLIELAIENNLPQ